jgi:hypothetical protein
VGYRYPRSRSARERFSDSAHNPFGGNDFSRMASLPRYGKLVCFATEAWLAKVRLVCLDRQFRLDRR